jgi:hypothetical protein
MKVGAAFFVHGNPEREATERSAHVTDAMMDVRRNASQCPGNTLRVGPIRFKAVEENGKTEERSEMGYRMAITSRAELKFRKGTHALSEKAMGRPPKDIKRDRQITTRAAASGTTPTEFGRVRMLAGRPGPVQSAVAAEAIHQNRLIEIQLRRLGNLLNQMVRHMHQTGEVLPDAVPLLKELRSMITGRGLP